MTKSKTTPGARQPPFKPSAPKAAKKRATPAARGSATRRALPGGAKPLHGASLWTQARADLICNRLALGESLRSICCDDGLPSESAVRMWVLDDVRGFAAQYARAREVGYDCMSEEILELADRSRIGVKTTNKATGIETTEGDMVERSRLQIDARKWLLSKMLPKRYGDKLELGGAVIFRKSAADLSDDELAAIAMGAGAKPAA